MWPLDDDANAELVNLVQPPGWTNPRPAARYDLVVLGGGTAGLVSAVGAAGLGARVALVERHLLGGDCLNVGCVPSKAMLRSARVVGELRRAASLGVTAGEVTVDFPGVMQRMRRRRASIAHHDSAARLQSLGIDVFFGTAAFTDRESVVVDGRYLRFKKAVIATGGRPSAPPVPGLNDVPFLTNESVFTLTELPRRLLVIGAGPIGCELAQAFARFGATVTVFDRASQLLPREDPDAAAVLHQHFRRDGITLALGAALGECRRVDGEIHLRYRMDAAGTDHEVAGDALLVAAGRAPNIEALNLGAAGIEATAQGVVVDDRLRTSNPRVYASGDVCSPYKFTHAADALSRVVLQNALFHGWKKASALVIPWVTYTDPEVAHVGLTHDEGKKAGVAEISVPLSDIDRAVVDDETDGFVRVYHERGRLRGATIVAPHAGELIGEFTYAMTHGGTLSALSATVHPYPTVGEAFRKAGDAYRRQSLTPRVRRWLQRYFAWTR